MNARKLLATAAALLLTAIIWLPLDADGDGQTNLREWQLGTSSLQADSDSDGLDDGWEATLGTDPLAADMDQDGVLDGYERALACVVNPDCDFDGLGDAAETGGYDPLDPDSFDVGLLDGVVKIYEAQGQPPTPDADLDGIPDGWEESDGLVDWGPFSPTPGQRDLLVEFLRVEGPQSGRFNLDLDDAYNAVAAMFAAKNIQLQWIETIVETASENRPGFLTEDDIGYYDAALAEGAGSLNPFVTTIVINAQQTQEDLAGDILGAAFLRSMIATLDLGAHVEITFEEDHSNGISLASEIVIEPVIESHIIGARPEQVRLLKSNNNGIVGMRDQGNGNLLLETESGGERFEWRWKADWFTTAPNVTVKDTPSQYIQLKVTDVEVRLPELASTIAHELGHTLGLCHAHNETCLLAMDLPDVSNSTVYSSTMSYFSPPDNLHFVNSEWKQIKEYLACPPQTPVVLRAEGASDSAFIQAKYYDSFTEQQDLRACGESTSVTPDLPEPLAASSTIDGGPWLAVYIVAGIGVAGLVWWRT